MFDLSMHILQVVIQVTIHVFFWSQLSQKRFAFPLTVLLAVIPTTAVMLITTYSDWSYTFISILKLTSCGLLYWLLFRGNLWHKIKALLLTAMISACCTISVEQLCILIYSIDLQDLNTMSAVRIAGMILLQDALFIAAVCTGIIVHRQKNAIKGQIRQLWIMMVFMLVHMLFAGVYFLDDAALHRKTDCVVQFVFQLVLIVIALIQYYSSLHTQMLLQKNQELQQMQVQQQFTFDYYTLAEQRFTEISRLRHDIRNLMQTVSVLSEHHSLKATAAKMVADIGERLNQTKAVQFCEHSLLNTILTLKLQAHADEDIVTDIVLQDINDIPISEQALCSYFAALMDAVPQAILQYATENRVFSLRSGRNAHFYVVKVLFPDTTAEQIISQTILHHDMIRSVMEQHCAMGNTVTLDNAVTVTMAFPMKN